MKKRENEKIEKTETRQKYILENEKHNESEVPFSSIFSLLDLPTLKRAPMEFPMTVPRWPMKIN